MDLICIDDKYTDEQIAVIPNRPEINQVVTFRADRRTREGDVGILLNEINNPKIPGVAGMMFEPGFASRRFRTLSGGEVTRSMIKEASRAFKYDKI